MVSSMNSFSHTILTGHHTRPAPTQFSKHSTFSRRTSSTLIHYAPLSKSSSSTLIEYAPVSTTTSPAFVYRPTPSTASTNIAPSSSRTADPSLSAHPNRQTTYPSVGFTVIVLILLGMMLAMATVMWLAESKGRQISQRLEYQERGILSKPRKPTEPIGLGITLHPAVEERWEIGGCERLKYWFSNVVEKGKSVQKFERWTDFVVSRAHDDLNMNAEDGLLLPVRASERIGSEKNRPGVELDTDRGW